MEGSLLNKLPLFIVLVLSMFVRADTDAVNYLSAGANTLSGLFKVMKCNRMPWIFDSFGTLTSLFPLYLEGSEDRNKS